MDIKSDTVYTVGEVAELLQVTTKTVRKWIKEGVLKAAALGGKKLGYRVTGKAVNEFWRQRETT